MWKFPWLRGFGEPVQPSASAPKQKPKAKEKPEDALRRRRRTFELERMRMAAEKQICVCLREAGLPEDVNQVQGRRYVLDTGVRGVVKQEYDNQWRQVVVGTVEAVQIKDGAELVLILSAEVCTRSKYNKDEETFELLFDCFDAKQHNEKKRGWHAHWTSPSERNKFEREYIEGLDFKICENTSVA